MNFIMPNLNLKISDSEDAPKRFVPEMSFSWYYIYEHFGKLNQKNLIQIATILSALINVKIPRDAKRRKLLLYKWFDDNWPLIQKHIGNIVIKDSE